MNVIAIMNHMGVYFKEEPIRELHRALERLDFRIVYPNDREDLLKLIENNARLCGVIFDWDKYNLELCEEISKLNEYMPLYAFANTYSTLDVSLNDLRMQVRFFEYALGAADDIADKLKIHQTLIGEIADEDFFSKALALLCENRVDQLPLFNQRTILQCRNSNRYRNSSQQGL